MRCLLLSCLIVFGYWSHANAQSISKANKQKLELEIEQVVEEQRQAALKNDTVKLEAIIAEDYLSTNANGEMRNKKQTVEFYKRNELEYKALEVSDMTIIILGPTAAFANFQVSTNEYYKGKDRSGQFRVTRVFVKRAGRWLVIANHSTSSLP